ncbi:MAG: hypothetical protein H6Q89_1538 [Myxococcaceae bacterium]|nr:hypothetical protein [Myxococcaceae bacterium]
MRACVAGWMALIALAGCKEPASTDPKKAAAPERPGLSVTVYQSGLELFMEYPALVVGQTSPLVAHFTDTRDPNAFHPVTQGQVTAVLKLGDQEERFVTDKPLRDGIFKPIVTPQRAGAATLTLILEGPQAHGTVEAGSVVVHPTIEAAIAAVEDPGSAEPTVGFLKEQQWKTEYATTEARVRVLQGGIRATAELKPVGGQAAELSAPVEGRIPVGDAVPHLGQKVKKGQLLVRIAPSASVSGTDLATVELEATRARSELGLAERDLARAQELFAAQAIPEKQLDAARVAKDVAAAKVLAMDRQQAVFKSAQAGSGSAGGSAFELRSPLDGVVSFAEVMPGAVVQAGTRLVSVVNTERLWLEARVYEADVGKVQEAVGASFTVTGVDREFSIDASNGKRIAVGAVVDRNSRTLPVLFELANPDGALKPGMFAKATLFTGQTVRAVAIPESAVVEEGGKPTVFVLDGGESFFKRAVRLGVRSGGYVQVLEGLKEGERVVSRGAYELKLAAASGGIPEHGHQH